MSKHKQLAKLIQHHYSLSLWGYWGVYVVAGWILPCLNTKLLSELSQPLPQASGLPAQSWNCSQPWHSLLSVQTQNTLNWWRCLETSVMMVWPKTWDQVICSQEQWANLRNFPALIIKFEPPNANHPIKTQTMRPEISVSCTPKFLFGSKLVYYSY